MHRQHPPESVRIAVSFGAFTATLTHLLAKQRAEEPGTAICLTETLFSEQIRGVMDGRYDLGFAVAPPVEAELQNEVLWHDEIAVAIPALSPLLEFAEITLEKAVQYPLVLWSAEHCEPLSRRIIQLLNSVTSKLNVVDHAKSFELMAVLVAAGYGIGFAGKSRIDTARKLGIVMRPLVGPRNDLSTYLLRAHNAPSPFAERLIERARKLDQSVSRS
ncbi:LysR family substrate-binding domain-containing protein [Erwinia sp. V71]|uniref:LysR family substrate-binding domain-containing protein n=1 Tax=Erwinia sp. V71 TaxID=3369424 RepID=UPI003F5F49D2